MLRCAVPRRGAPRTPGQPWQIYHPAVRVESSVKPLVKGQLGRPGVGAGVASGARLPAHLGEGSADHAGSSGAALPAGLPLGCGRRSPANAGSVSAPSAASAAAAPVPGLLQRILAFGNGENSTTAFSATPPAGSSAGASQAGARPSGARIPGASKHIPKQFALQQQVEALRSGEYLGPDWPFNFLGSQMWNGRRYACKRCE